MGPSQEGLLSKLPLRIVVVLIACTTHLNLQTVQEDYLVFDGYALFADLGGLIGVLLGISSITLFDYLVKALFMLSSMGRAKGA